MGKKQYDQIAKTYSDPRRMEHPQRKFMIYPTWLNACGKIAGKEILDVGCGSGGSSRILATRWPKSITALDSSLEQIKIAVEREKKFALGIEYLVADLAHLPGFQKRFDLVTGVLVLHYARTIEELEMHVKNIADNLWESGKFVGIINNPEKPIVPYQLGFSTSERWLDEPFVEGSRIEITFRDLEGNTFCDPFINYYWSKSTYEEVFEDQGMMLRWITPKMNQKGRENCPNWKNLEEGTCLIVIVAEMM